MGGLADLHRPAGKVNSDNRAPASQTGSCRGTMTTSARRLSVSILLLCIGSILSGCGYNTIPTLDEQAKARWSDVQNQYQRRADLIPNLATSA
jgi:LemA protein